jgi:hypothetical protein
MGAYFDELSLVAFDETNGEAKEVGSTILALSTQTPSGQGPASHLNLTSYAITGRETYQAGDDHALAIDALVRSRVECVGGASACPGLTPSTVDFPLRFLFDGVKFELAPASEDTFRRMKARERG